MTEPTRDALHAATLAMLGICAQWHRDCDDHPEAEQYAHAAECVRFVAALDAGEIVQFSGWGKAADPSKFGIRLRTAGPMDFGFGPDVLTAFRAAQDHLGGGDA